MIPTRVIIGAAGNQVRWNCGCRGVCVPTLKQMVPVYGQPLIHRSISQYFRILKAYEVVVVGFSEELVKYGAVLLKPTGTALHNSCIGSSVEAWVPNMDLFIVMGDVCWTDEAIEKVAVLSLDVIWFVGRSSKDRLHLPEIYGIKVPAQKQDHFRQVIKDVNQLKIEKPNIAAGWMCYRHLHGMPIDQHEIRGGFLEIDDDTEDFDHPSEYKEWLANMRNKNIQA